MQGYAPHGDPYGHAPQHHQDSNYVAALHAAHGSHPTHPHQVAQQHDQHHSLPPPAPQHNLYAIQEHQHQTHILPQPGQTPQGEIEGAAAGTRKRKAAAMSGGSEQAGASTSGGSQTGGRDAQDDDDDEKPSADGKKGQGGSEFVKKLFKYAGQTSALHRSLVSMCSDLCARCSILDEGNFNDIVSWGIDGTSFVVHVRRSAPRTPSWSVR